jgi:hypothetical protein
MDFHILTNKNFDFFLVNKNSVTTVRELRKEITFFLKNNGTIITKEKNKYKIYAPLIYKYLDNSDFIGDYLRPIKLKNGNFRYLMLIEFDN